MTNISANNNISALNYRALQLEETGATGRSDQLGSETSVKEEKRTDLTDGLSSDELKSIDGNNDGIVTEAEFKTRFGSGYKTYWQNYTSFYNTEETKDGNGNNVIKQTLQDGRVVTTVMNGNKLVSSESVQIDGVKVNKEYAADGVTPAKETSTVNNGTVFEKNYDNKGNLSTEVTTTKDGTTTTFNSDGKLIGIKSPGREEINIDYESKTVTIGKTTYTNFETDENGKITIKSDDGESEIMTINADESGKTNVVTYQSNGKMQSSFDIEADRSASAIYDYDENGHYKRREFCTSGGHREFTWSEDGHFTESNDFNANGVRTTRQTYYTGEKVYDNNWMLWNDITYYNDEGEICSYQKYDYERAENGDVKQTVQYMDKPDGTVNSKRVQYDDHFGNTISYQNIDTQTGTITSETKNIFEDDCYNKTTGELKQLWSGDKIKKTETTKGTEKITKTYSNGNVMTEEISDSANKENNFTKTYTRHFNGNIASELVKYRDGSSVLTNRDADGNRLSHIEKNKHGYETLRTVYADGKALKTTKTKYDETIPSMKVSVETIEGEDNTATGTYKLEYILRDMYPEFNDTQITTLKRKIAALNGFDSTDLIPYNKGSKSIDFQMPQFRDSGFGYLIFD